MTKSPVAGLASAVYVPVATTESVGPPEAEEERPACFGYPFLVSDFEDKFRFTMWTRCLGAELLTNAEWRRKLEQHWAKDWKASLVGNVDAFAELVAWMPPLLALDPIREVLTQILVLGPKRALDLIGDKAHAIHWREGDEAGHADKRAKKRVDVGEGMVRAATVAAEFIGDLIVRSPGSEPPTSPTKLMQQAHQEEDVDSDDVQVDRVDAEVAKDAAALKILDRMRERYPKALVGAPRRFPAGTFNLVYSTLAWEDCSWLFLTPDEEATARASHPTIGATRWIDSQWIDRAIARPLKIEVD